MPYTIGIDIGTSSAKAVLIDETGKVIFTTAPSYEFRTPQPLWAESDPEDWWQATIKALREITAMVNPAEIAGIGLTGQMHGLVLLDKDGNVLRPCIMWNDQRTGAQCRQITEKVGAKEVLRLTGNPVLPGFTAPKVVWVQQNEPEIWAKAAKILLPKDYIRYRLSGGFFTDVSDASGMSLLNVGERNWSVEMLEACDIPREFCAEVTESITVSAKIGSDAAKLTGLSEGLPIVAGGGDQAAGAVGCGIVEAGRVSCTLGTSGVLFAHAENYQPDAEGRLHTFCAAVPGKWHFMGVQLSCAGSYQWFRDKLAPDQSFEQLNTMAETVDPGAEGLYFLPYLSGERTPHPDPLARGVFFGLTLRHGRGHMARAVMEGVSYGLRDALEIMRNLGLKPSEIIASGGGAKSPLWRQMLADIFATPITTVNATEGAAFGAAVLASVGVGIHPSVEEACKVMIRETSRLETGPDREQYDMTYPLYQDLYPALKPMFERIR